MDIKGKLVEVFPTRKVSDKFQIREFVIETEGKYPQSLIIQVSQERCTLLDNLAAGEMIQAFINLRGRSWTNPKGEVKYFNTIEAWKISNESAQSFNSYQEPIKVKGNIESNFKENIIDDLVQDDLPF